MKKMAEDEHDRIKLAEQKLGESGLKIKSLELKAACELNEVCHSLAHSLAH